MSAPSPAIARFLALVGSPRDGALLRYALGNEYLKAGDAAGAVPHLREAVTRDPRHSAAWKLLGRALADTGDATAARAAWIDGIAAADAAGDRQAAKEMQVFVKRLDRAAGAPPAGAGATPDALRDDD